MDRTFCVIRDPRTGSVPAHAHARARHLGEGEAADREYEERAKSQQRCPDGPGADEIEEPERLLHERHLRWSNAAALPGGTS